MHSKSRLTAILFYISIALLLISIHQSMYYGFTKSYFMYMITFSVYLWYNVRRTKEKAIEKERSNQEAPSKINVKELYKKKK
jgi:general stress protein CsbA